MEKSTILICLTMFTLLIGVAIAVYQLFSAHRSQQKGPHSALAARYGGKPTRDFRPLDEGVTPDPRGQARPLNAVSNPAAEAAERS